MAITHLLNRAAVWLRNTGNTGDHGRFTEGLEPVQAEPLLCRLQIASAPLKTVGTQQRTEATHVIFTDPGVALLRDDVLRIEGKDYRVVTGEPPSKPEHHLRWTAFEEQYSVP